MSRALHWISEAEPRTIEAQIELCEIPAPPFEEGGRAAEYRRRFAAAGLERVGIDGEGNVVGVRPGSGEGGSVVVSAHLDTVFPAGTDVTVTRDGDILRGPGIGDDCRGLAVVLSLLHAMNAVGIRTAWDVVFAGTVGEEGGGNLRGVRHLLDHTLADRPDAFISVDGTGIRMVTDGVGSHRYRVRFHGPGGHSFGAFGMPNPIHALGRAVDAISRIEVPEAPRTTFSVGRVEGGTSVNSIAGEAVMEVDLRSTDPDALGRLDDSFRAAVDGALAEERARWRDGRPLEVEVLDTGRRPAARQDPASRALAASRNAGAALGVEPTEDAASTDANYPMSLGIPSVTLGAGGRGGNAHTLEEWFDTNGSDLGSRWVLLSTLLLAGVG